MPAGLYLLVTNNGKIFVTRIYRKKYSIGLCTMISFIYELRNTSSQNLITKIAQSIPIPSLLHITDCDKEKIKEKI